MGTETAVYFERVDGDLEGIEMHTGKMYGGAVEHIREEYGMDIDEEWI
jgi:hypothetical protein